MTTQEPKTMEMNPRLGTRDTVSKPAPADALSQALQMCRTGRFHDAMRIYEKLLEIQPDNVMALTNLGGIKCCVGDPEGAIEYLSRARALAPDDEQVNQNLFAAYGRQSDLAMSTGGSHTALAASRAILALDMEQHAVRANLTELLEQVNTPARLSDFTNDFGADALGKKILVACMPKSGSTWLSTVLGRLTGFKRASFAYAYRQNEQDLYLPHLLATARTDTVTQLHCRATVANLHIMQGFAIAPIVLVRNLYDVLISLVDFYNTGAVHNTFLYSDYLTLDRTARIDLVIEHVAPWYIQFFTSWVLAARQGKIPVHWIQYEEMMENKCDTLVAALAYHDIHKSAADIDATIGQLEAEKSRTRFNKGVAGRGVQEMNEQQIARLRGLIRFHPSIDYAPIGL